jgi:hypothetical protein
MGDAHTHSQKNSTLTALLNTHAHIYVSKHFHNTYITLITYKEACQGKDFPPFSCLLTLTTAALDDPSAQLRSLAPLLSAHPTPKCVYKPFESLDIGIADSILACGENRAARKTHACPAHARAR